MPCWNRFRRSSESIFGKSDVGNRYTLLIFNALCHNTLLEDALMTKADLVEAIHEQVGLSKKESADIVELVFDTMKDTLEKAEKIKISGFGSFTLRDKAARRGRNPQTNETIILPPRQIPPSSHQPRKGSTA